MIAPVRTRVAVAAAALSAALIGGMAGTAIAPEDRHQAAAAPRPAGAVPQPDPDRSAVAPPRTTPRTATHSK